MKRQFTGIKDKNGKKIFEGDIIFDPNWWWGPGEVFLNRGQCGPCRGDSVMSYLCRGKETISHNIWNGKDVTILGNIHDNPEIIKNWKRDLSEEEKKQNDELNAFFLQKIIENFKKSKMA